MLYARKLFISEILALRQRIFGPEYELEAIRRLNAGYSIVYDRDGVVTIEYPDGRRFEVTVDVEANYALRYVRELTPATLSYAPSQAVTDTEGTH